MASVLGYDHRTWRLLAQLRPSALGPGSPGGTSSAMQEAQKTRAEVERPFVSLGGREWLTKQQVSNASN